MIRAIRFVLAAGVIPLWFTVSGCGNAKPPAATESPTTRVYRPAVSIHEQPPNDNSPHQFRDIALTPSASEIVFSNQQLTLRFDRHDGAWVSLNAAGLEENMIAAGKPAAATDFRIDGQWMLETQGATFLRQKWNVDETRGSASLQMVYGVGARKPFSFIPERWKDRAPAPSDAYAPPENYEFELTSSYTLFPNERRIERSATLVRNLSKDFFHSSFRRLDGFLFIVPSAVVEHSNDCTVEVPGPVYTYSFIDAGTPYDELSSTYIDCKTAPDRLPGIVGIENRKAATALSTWMDTKSEVVYEPYLSGDGKRISILFHSMRSDRLPDRATINSDVQTIELTPSFRDAQADHVKVIERSMPLSDTTPSWVRDMVILEMLPDFYPGGFKGVAEHLSFYRGIGFNTLYLLPHWLGGYRNVDPLTVNPALGTPEDLKALVRKAHDLGMHVVFDMVIHGFAPESPVVKQHPEFFTRNEQGLIETHFNWGSINTDPGNPAYQQYMMDLVRHDVREYDIDGFRVDANSYKSPNWDPADPRRPWEASSTLPLYRKMYDAMREEKKEIVLYSEMFGPCWHSVSNLAQDANWAVVVDLFDRMDQGLITAASYKAGLAELQDSLQPGVNRIRFCRNHDTCWFFPKHYKGFTPRFLALDAVHFCFGVPLVFAGDRQFPPSLEDNPVACSHYHRLIALRTQFPELARGESLFHEVECDNPWVFTGLRKLGNHTSLVVISLSDKPGKATLRLHLDNATLAGLTLKCLADGKGVTLPESGASLIELEPFQILSGRLPRP